MNKLLKFALIFVAAVNAYCGESTPSTKEPAAPPRNSATNLKEIEESDLLNGPNAGEDDKVFLDVDFAILKIGREPATVKYTFLLTITNVSKSDITVPTRSVDGEPCCWMDGSVDKGVSYHVGKYRIGEHLIVPSPLKFSPVVLRPGESTEFARYSYNVDSKHPLKSFSADLTVDKAYGESQGWWTGSVPVKIDLTKRKPIDPDF